MKSPGAAALLLGAAGFAAAMVLARIFIPGLQRAPTVTNFRGRRVPVVGGMVIVSAFLFAEAAGLLWRRDLLLSRGNAAALILAAGFFSLGVVDDYSSTSGARGLRGHVAALRRGTVTSGMIKAGGGLLVALGVSMFMQTQSKPALIALDTLIIALSANLANLLDLRPGRTVKAYLLAWAPLALAAWPSRYFVVSAAVSGAAAGWLGSDLSEKAVLGDAGSNLLGAIAGGGAALSLGAGSKAVLVTALAGLTLASEKFSFTAAIAATPPLRWLDCLGRAPEGEMPESFPDRAE